MLKFLFKTALLAAGTGLVLNAIKEIEEGKKETEEPEESSEKPAPRHAKTVESEKEEEAEHE